MGTIMKMVSPQAEPGHCIKTNTNVVLNAIASCPFKWKTGLMNCLLNRVWNICSPRAHFEEEVKKLKSIFEQNGYSGNLFSNKAKSFVDKKSVPNLQNSADKEDEKT